MQALARVAVELAVGTDGRARNRLAVLRSEPPLVLRPIVAAGSDGFMRWEAGHARPATVTVVAGSAGPLGGDRLRLEVEVGPGSMLVLSEVAATLLLPGPNGEESLMEIDIRVDTNGTLVWLPEPVIAVRGCRHRTEIRVSLASGGRLFLREEVMLGRYGEQPGMLRQHLRVQIDGRPLLDQELAVGFEASGWDGPAVTGNHRALGMILVVDPETCQRIPATLEGDAAILPLAGPAVLVSVLAPDTLALRRQLDAGLALLDNRPAQPRCDQGGPTVNSLHVHESSPVLP
jgi:urease accessory protein